MPIAARLLAIVLNLLPTRPLVRKHPIPDHILERHFIWTTEVG
jgi:hypothetical protein